MAIKEKINYSNGLCGVYAWGFIGALVYNIQQASTFLEGVLGVLKAIVWPAFVVYQIHKFFQL